MSMTKRYPSSLCSKAITRDSAVVRTPCRGAIKTRHSDVITRKEERYPPRAGAEKKQEKPGSKQEKFNGREYNGTSIIPRYNPRRERNDLGGLQHSVRVYNKGGPGPDGVVGIGSAAVSLLCVLSEAASAI